MRIIIAVFLALKASEIKCKDKPQHLVRFVDSEEVDFCFIGFIRSTVLNNAGCEMVRSILVADFEMRGGPHLSHQLFGGSKGIEFLNPLRATIVAAFVDGDDDSSFPFVESMVAMGTVVFGFPFAQPFVILKGTFRPYTLAKFFFLSLN